jgi:pimeloyl-ACP methyl ester carboxylesterase
MTAGRGDPLLFLHGWGLTPRSYADAVVRLCAAGVQVLAPSLPGFGRSTPLPLGSGLAGYAERTGQLVDRLDLGKPCFVVGHSFGGGVAIRLAADRPDLVRSLTVVNTIGGAASGSGLRPGSYLRWLAGAATEFHPREWVSPATPGLLRDLAGTLTRRPWQSLSAGLVALTAGLAPEAARLVASGMPVLFVWGDRDRLITPGALAEVAGDLGPEVVRGRHGWMLTAPEEFAAVLHNALVVHAMLERRRRGQPGTLPAGMSLAQAFPPERRRRARHTPWTGG